MHEVRVALPLHLHATQDHMLLVKWRHPGQEPACNLCLTQYAVTWATANLISAYSNEKGNFHINRHPTLEVLLCLPHVQEHAFTMHRFPTGETVVMIAQQGACP